MYNSRTRARLPACQEGRRFKDDVIVVTGVTIE
jgi:hypothetical protein